MSLLSLIVPVFNEREAAPLFYEEVVRVAPRLGDVEWEIIYVDDGSRDDTLAVVKRLAERDARVHYVSFSRNFGKEAALYAGLRHASGDYVALMDVDLQDPPSLLPEMLQRVTAGECDCVGTRRVNRRGEPPLRSWFARRFYALINRMSRTEVVDGARDYQLMSRQVADAILSIGEYNRFSKGIFGWVGFRKVWLEYENVERVAGETKWSFWKLFAYAIEGIAAYSTIPLVISFFLGLALCVGSLLFIVGIVIRTLVFGDPTSGWPSLVCIVVLLSGIQMLFLGVLGQYLAKTYLETKRRPIYLVRESNIALKDATS